MIRAVIIDDELAAIELLGTLLRDFIPGVEVVGEASSVKDAIAVIRKEDPDLVFMDIQMPQGGGFAILRSFDELPFAVIFTTAYDEYAIKAIQFSALDYILKPITVSRLQDSIQRYKQAQDKKALKEGNVYLLPDNLINLHQQTTKMVIPIPKGMKIVTIADMVFIKADGVYAEVLMTDETKIVVSKGLKHFEQLLKDYGLVRVHDSYIVNLQHVDRYMRGRGGEIYMKNGERIEVSRGKKENFLRLLRRR